MNRPSAIDAPIALGTFLGADDLDEITRGFTELHGVGVGVCDHSGALTVTSGDELDGDSLRALIGGDEFVDLAKGRLCIVPLLHDGQDVGVIAVGPYRGDAQGRLPQLDDAEAKRLAGFVGCMLGVLIHSAYARHLTTEMHVAAMDETFRSLESKNQQLALAVERMQEFDRLKSNFLATVSHELRTPLTSVIGYSEMLLEGLAGPLNEEQSEYVQTVLAKADQLLQLITGILDASLMESGSLSIERRPLVLRDVIESVVATFHPQARKRGIAIAMPSGELPRAIGDGRKIQQVLWNLVANAVKFTHDGGDVAITLEVGPLSPNDDSGRFGAPSGAELDYGLRVSIRDSGIGISPEKQANIFEPFFQVDSSSTREYGGTGLGLTLAKRYIEAHGGNIWVASALGSGSVFSLSLPAVPEELAAYIAKHVVSG